VLSLMLDQLTLSLICFASVLQDSNCVGFDCSAARNLVFHCVVFSIFCCLCGKQHGCFIQLIYAAVFSTVKKFNAM